MQITGYCCRTHKNVNKLFCASKTLMFIILCMVWILLLVQPGYDKHGIAQRQDLHRLNVSSLTLRANRSLLVPDAKTLGSHQSIFQLRNLKDLSTNILFSRHPRYGINECVNFTIKLYRPNTFHQTALVSYPGSGNTWTRHLIEFATGVFTGSIYCDITLLGRGFRGEREPWNSGSTIVQKTHLGYSLRYPFSKAIVLLREPYKAIISFVQYLEGGHVGHASQSTFYNKKWPTYILGQTFTWISVTKSWLESPAKLLIIHYEHLLTNLKKELQRICDFLNIDCSSVNHACFDRNIDGLFHRKGKVKPKVPLSKEVREKVDDGIDFLSKLLVSNGHEPIPVHLYKFYRLNQTDTVFAN